MADLPPVLHRVLVLVAPTREERDRIVSALSRRLGARVVSPVERCTCPMSLRSARVHSLACPCSPGLA